MDTETNSASTGTIPIDRKNISSIVKNTITNTNHDNKSKTLDDKSNIQTHSPTGLNKWMLKKTYDAIGCPPIQIQLWNGLKFGCKNEEAVSKIDRKSVV